jgi:TPR repeat protein
MKYTFNQISHSFLLGSSLIAGSLASVSANDNLIGQKIAVYQPASSIAAPLLNSELSPEKMLAMADSLYSPRMSKAQKELEFALIFSAANKGLAEAQFRLANFYMDSDLIEANETEAAFWLEEAIEQGHKNAIYVYNNIFGFDFGIGC